MGQQHVIAIDQGTTGSTVLVLDRELAVVGRANREFRQIYPKPGWVEHDPADIWDSVVQALKAALGQGRVAPDSIAAIGITNQRETVVVWDRKTLAPVGNAIVWQDRRTADMCRELKDRGLEADVRAQTGLVLDPYFSGTKLRWMLEHDADLAARAGRGEICFGTVDSYLIARLSAGAAHVTDVSNASRTLLFDIGELSWSPSLLEMLSIPHEMLPEVRPCSGVFAETRGVDGLPDGIPIAGAAGDQQSALFGQACFAPGDTKCTFGTGAFILMNTGEKPVPSRSGLLTTVAWKLGAGAEKGEVCYALEGSAFIAGAAVQWLRDGLGVIDHASEVESLARSVEDSGGVTFVPALAGLGAPHWRPEARGIITGLTRGTTRAHLARACLEGIALQNHDLIAAMQRDAGATLGTLKVDGGAAANDLLMQMQADIIGAEISRPEILETTALGAAFLAGLGCGIWTSKEQIKSIWREQARFSPSSDHRYAEQALTRWNSAIAKA